MIFEISHISEYTYSDEVSFEPHYFRFKPKNTPYLRVRDFEIKIEPEPSGLSEQIDVENNHILLCWFEGTYRQLKITSHSFIEAREYNPFNFLVHPPEYLKLPFEYDKKIKQLLKPLLYSEGLPNEMIDYRNDILLDSGNGSIDFLTELTKTIHKDFILKSRETGKPHQPEYTFKQKTGSCRDLAWMQIHLLRQSGIASRFVSGYYYIDNENPEFELHAWVEAYLPGAGWIGLDPGHGIFADAFHIPVAISAFQENTMPVSGTIRGNSKSELKNELHISLSD